MRKESDEESKSIKPNIPTRSSSAIALAIVPVHVKAKGGSAFVETYAFLGLLIGSDVPEALQPIEVRSSERGGPWSSWKSKSKIPTVNLVQSN